MCRVFIAYMNIKSIALIRMGNCPKYKHSNPRTDGKIENMVLPTILMILYFVKGVDNNYIIQVRVCHANHEDIITQRK